ncbi:MAG: hypothetical protein PF517_20735 [Salinivirgaceae bacterium]|jgi:hypothetical protein|nr:hypothetical protein [Salinivirgaceae bacterium]
MFKKYILFIIIFSPFQYNFAQECFEYYKSACIPKSSNFIYTENNSSVSFQFTSGELKEIPFTLILGIDYRITLCADKKFEDIIKFIIRAKDGNEIYNNSQQNFNLNLEFACRKTQDVTFELIAPEPNIGNNDTVLIDGCMGVLVEEMVSVKTGF